MRTQRLLNIVVMTLLAGTFNQCSTNSVKPKPVAQYTYTAGQDGSVTFTSQSTNATTLTWNYGDGSTADFGSPVTHKFVTDGNFTVTLTATGGGGTATNSESVNIANADVGSFTFNGTQYGGATGSLHDLWQSSNIDANITDQTNSNTIIWINNIPTK